MRAKDGRILCRKCDQLIVCVQRRQDPATAALLVRSESAKFQELIEPDEADAEPHGCDSVDGVVNLLSLRVNEQNFILFRLPVEAYNLPYAQEAEDEQDHAQHGRNDENRRLNGFLSECLLLIDVGAAHLCMSG